MPPGRERPFGVRALSALSSQSRYLYTPTLLLEEGDDHEQHLRPRVMLDALREVLVAMPVVLVVVLVVVAVVIWTIVARLIVVFDGNYD